MAAEVIVLGSQHATPDVGAVGRERGLHRPAHAGGVVVLRSTNGTRSSVT